MDSAESYDFMNQSVPNILQGPLNFGDSVGTMFKTLNEISYEQTRQLGKG